MYSWRKAESTEQTTMYSTLCASSSSTPGNSISAALHVAELQFWSCDALASEAGAMVESQLGLAEEEEEGTGQSLVDLRFRLVFLAAGGRGMSGGGAASCCCRLVFSDGVAKDDESRGWSKSVPNSGSRSACECQEDIRIDMADCWCCPRTALLQQCLTEYVEWSCKISVVPWPLACLFVVCQTAVCDNGNLIYRVCALGRIYLCMSGQWTSCSYQIRILSCHMSSTRKFLLVY